MYYLWSERYPKRDRKRIKKEISRIISTLKNSVKNMGRIAILRDSNGGLVMQPNTFLELMTK
jgi:hypothetical protein